MRRRLAVAFVLHEIEHGAVVGYYTLSATAVEGAGLPDGAVRRLPRYPYLPAIRIGRFAVDRRFQGMGLARVLLIDALKRSNRAADQIGATFVIVDAKDDAARVFCEHYGFRRFSDDQHRLFLPMATVAQLGE